MTADSSSSAVINSFWKMAPVVGSGRAYNETGLPVWLGVSCKEHPDTGDVVSFSHEKVAFDVPLDALIPMKPDMVNIMHSEIRTIPRAIEMVKKRWDGPIGVYPESGHFVKPNWDFVDVLPPDDLAIEAKAWLKSGVQLLGGCCGTGPEHIRVLRTLIETK